MLFEDLDERRQKSRNLGANSTIVSVCDLGVQTAWLDEAFELAQEPQSPTLILPGSGQMTNSLQMSCGEVDRLNTLNDGLNDVGG